VALTDVDATVTLLSGLAILVGLFGIVIPILPGLILCWLGVLGWAVYADRGWGRWLVLAAASAVALTGLVAKYAWPGRNLRRSGVSNLSLFVGGIFGIVGFFVVPVVGVVLGFVLGVYVAERIRLHRVSQNRGRLAWASTKHALKAVGLSMLIELTAGLFIAGIWIAGVLAA